MKINLKRLLEKSAQVWGNFTPAHDPDSAREYIDGSKKLYKNIADGYNRFSNSVDENAYKGLSYLGNIMVPRPVRRFSQKLIGSALGAAEGAALGFVQSEKEENKTRSVPSLSGILTGPNPAQLNPSWKNFQDAWRGFVAGAKGGWKAGPHAFAEVEDGLSNGISNAAMSIGSIFSDRIGEGLYNNGFLRKWREDTGRRSKNEEEKLNNELYGEEGPSEGEKRENEIAGKIKSFGKGSLSLGADFAAYGGLMGVAGNVGKVLNSANIPNLMNSWTTWKFFGEPIAGAVNKEVFSENGSDEQDAPVDRFAGERAPEMKHEDRYINGIPVGRKPEPVTINLST